SAICSYDAAAVTFNATAGTAPFNVQLQVTAPGGGVSTINQVIPDNGPATINVIPLNSAGGSYTVTLQSITDNNNCSRTTGFTPVTIVVTAQPNATVAAPAPVCEGSSVTLTASGADTYQWSPSTGLSATTGSTVTANPLTTTTYQVVGTTNGCSDTTQVTVTINPRPAKPAATTPVVYCEADAAATLAASPDAGNNLTWYDNSALINGTATPPTPSTTTAGTVYYYVTQTNAGGCESDTARIAVTVNPKPALSFTLPSAICKGDDAMFTNNSFVADNSGLTYNWDFGDGNTSNGMSPTHTYATYNSYNITLSATSGYGCQSQVSQTLPASAFYDSPVVDFSSAATVCQNESTGFTNLSTAPNSTITSALWSFGDGTTSTQTNPDKTYSRPGTFTVKLEATNAQGCKAEFSKDIVVNLQPVVDAGRSFVVPQGTTVQFEPSVNDTTLSFLWTPSADFADPTKLRQILTVNKDETYTLSVTGQGGCVASDFMTVKVQKPIEIPNSFSPNGDGIFDTWIIKNINDYQGASVEVYNRYGQQVFYSVGYNRPWDGTMSGKPVPFGTYYYVVKLKNGFQPMTGSVTIIR
ncbi:MAG TPA: PKD domain-containing protein, partial [Chitinophagaceae bacterium]